MIDNEKFIRRSFVISTLEIHADKARQSVSQDGVNC